MTPASIHVRRLALCLGLAAALPAFAATASAKADASAKKPFDARILANLERVSSPTLSPNGRKLVFAVRQTDYAANKGTTGLWIEDLAARDAAAPVRFTAEGLNVNSPAFSPDGASVYFLSAKSGSMQLWSQPVAGGAALQVSNYPLDVGSYKLSPDGKSVAFSLETFAGCADLACTKKRLDDTAANKASGVVFDKTFIRHWDTWSDGRRSQLFAARLGADGKLAAAPVLVSRGIDGDVPSKPFGDAGDYDWAPDGRSLAFSVRIAGTTEPTSTNFDIYRADVDGTSPPRNLTAGNKAWDAGPVFAADGRTLYYRAMKRPGFEADRLALMAMDLGSGATREIDPAWDATTDSIRLSADGKRIYTQALDLGDHPLFSVDIASGKVTRVAGEGSISGFDLQGDTLAFTRDTMASPDVLFVARADGSAVRKISVNNDATLANIAWGAYEPFQFKGWNGDTVHGYVVKPANYVAGQTYPVAFLIHGGPQGSFGNGWSYRWNPQTYAGQGFAVVMVDFHGSVGYGQAFTDAISQHWGDRPLEDLQKGWAAALAKYPFLDGDRACALGASYGGYMVNWIAGNWSQPWKCLVTHDGVFDARMMAYSTEEQWFSDWENGGTPYGAPAAVEKFNPALHVADWKVPMLIVHGQRDYRIPLEQGIGAFTAAQRRGIESRLLYFPDENHWVLKPQNSVLWHDTVNAWIERWTAKK
jgi:dipeptidyl aminopeptidase/acylaminoacyl peptidase